MTKKKATFLKYTTGYLPIIKEGHKVVWSGRLQETKKDALTISERKLDKWELLEILK